MINILFNTLGRIVVYVAAFSVPTIVFAQEKFVLLTGEDGPFNSISGEANLPEFLNQLYTLCIGIAVVIAILQIIRGGILWMLTDSVTEKGQAKHLVTVAIMGLILVLSPVIVFNIINPCILNLSLTGSGECAGSLQELKPTLNDPDDSETDSADTEQRGAYVFYANLPAAEAGLFKEKYCATAEYKADDRGSSIRKEVLCNNLFTLPLYFVCNESDDCWLSAAQNVTDGSILQTFINECEATQVAQTHVGTRFTTTPIDELGSGSLQDCSDEQLEDYRKKYPNALKPGQYLSCSVKSMYCKYK